jgi:site-specific DNA-methyltransferase (adenine-specific)
MSAKKTSGSRIVLDDCAKALSELPPKLARLIYVDPPFNTGGVQKRDRMRVVRSSTGERRGFGGERYAALRVASSAYADTFDDYLAFLMPRLQASLRCMTDDGSLFVHLDWREVHHVKVALDQMMGRDHFQNEIVWAYDYGGRGKRKWPQKHDSILWYTKSTRDWVFEYDAIDRIPYMAPGLVGPEKAARGKTPTDVWWHTIVPTSGSEKTGYPTQKPLGILRRIVRVHSKPGDTVLDFFAGSGTTGEAAALEGRQFVLVDNSSSAVAVCKKRLGAYHPTCVGF